MATDQSDGPLAPKYKPRPFSKNEREVRALILAALEILPACDLALLEQLRKAEPFTFHSMFLFPEPFQFSCPDFHRYEESIEEWSARTDAELQRAWQQALAEHVETLHGWKRWDEDIDGLTIAEPKRRRGPGKTGRTSSFEDRCKWAAERILGRGWKEIAGQYLPDRQNAAATVRQGATELLRTAHLDEFIRKLKPTKRK